MDSSDDDEKEEREKRRERQKKEKRKKKEQDHIKKQNLFYVNEYHDFYYEPKKNRIFIKQDNKLLLNKDPDILRKGAKNYENKSHQLLMQKDVLTKIDKTISFPIDPKTGKIEKQFMRKINNIKNNAYKPKKLKRTKSSSPKIPSLKEIKQIRRKSGNFIKKHKCTPLNPTKKRRFSQPRINNNFVGITLNPIKSLKSNPYFYNNINHPNKSIACNYLLKKDEFYLNLNLYTQDNENDNHLIFDHEIVAFKNSLKFPLIKTILQFFAIIKTENDWSRYYSNTNISPSLLLDTEDLPFTAIIHIDKDKNENYYDDKIDQHCLWENVPNEIKRKILNESPKRILNGENVLNLDEWKKYCNLRASKYTDKFISNPGQLVLTYGNFGHLDPRNTRYNYPNFKAGTNLNRGSFIAHSLYLGYRGKNNKLLMTPFIIGLHIDH